MNGIWEDENLLRIACICTLDPAFLYACIHTVCCRCLEVCAPSHHVGDLQPSDMQSNKSSRHTHSLRRQSIAVMMCGVQSPSMGRRAPPPAADANGASALKSEPAAPTTAAAAVGTAPPATAPEPYGAESKEFVEMRALNRYSPCPLLCVCSL